MKRIYTSLGVAAIGVASIQVAQGQSDLSKAWTASASLRGFYDDNVNTTHSDKVDSFGVDVSPALGIVLPMEETTLSASYVFDYKYYDKKINNRDGHDTMTHTFAFDLKHNFSERLVASVRDSFVVGQEPDIIRVGNSAQDTTQYQSGDNIRNYGAVVFNAQITRPFGIEVGYANALYDYDDTTVASTGARLNRLEHDIHLDGRYYLQRNTVGIIGYQFTLVDYTADQLLNPAPSTIMSDDRNNLSHIAYAGVEHNFLANLIGNFRAGARFNDYYNSEDDQNGVSPYIRSSLSYEYAKESRLEFGTSHDRTATDQYSEDAAGNLTQDANTTVVYLALTHRIMPRLIGNLIGNFQYSTYNGGTLDDEHQKYFGLGVNLEYAFNRHVSANVGYNYDRVESDSNVSDGDWDRNRVYVGATVLY